MLQSRFRGRHFKPLVSFKIKPAAATLLSPLS
jgi:hypothetical protein